MYVRASPARQYLLGWSFQESQKWSLTLTGQPASHTHDDESDRIRSPNTTQFLNLNPLKALRISTQRFIYAWDSTSPFWRLPYAFLRAIRMCTQLSSWCWWQTAAAAAATEHESALTETAYVTASSVYVRTTVDQSARSNIFNAAGWTVKTITNLLEIGINGTICSLYHTHEKTIRLRPFNITM